MLLGFKEKPKTSQRLQKPRSDIGKVWTANDSVRRSITDECKFSVSVKECCCTHRPQQHNNNNTIQNNNIIQGSNNRKCFFLSARQKCNKANRKCKVAFPMIVCTTVTAATTTTATTAAQQQFECHSF